MADPIMVAGSAASLWALYTWQKNGKTRYAVAVGLLTGLTILLKSVAGIILILPFALLILSSFPLREIFKNRQIWLILLLAALPTALFYYYGLVIDGRLTTQFKGRFFPEIWTDIVFYKSWGLRIIQEFNLLAFVAGLLGILLAKTKQIRLMLLGWWAGYFIYGMVFAYHIWTHDYYHLPMVPLVAVSLAPTAAYFEERAKENNYSTPALILFLCICLGFGVYSSNKTVKFLSVAHRLEIHPQGGSLDSPMIMRPASHSTIFFEPITGPVWAISPSANCRVPTARRLNSFGK
jgi:4-amino-4-deoxy-L-arabinose transferase-like glycosyltransferase